MSLTVNINQPFSKLDWLAEKISQLLLKKMQIFHYCTEAFLRFKILTKGQNTVTAVANWTRAKNQQNNLSSLCWICRSPQHPAAEHETHCDSRRWETINKHGSTKNCRHSSLSLHHTFLFAYKFGKTFQTGVHRQSNWYTNQNFEVKYHFTEFSSTQV